MKKLIIWAAVIAVAGSALTGCGGAKLSVADEQMARGEYYDASKTYRKIYNKLTKREQRPQRGEVAYKMGKCYQKLNMAARASASYQNAIRYGVTDSMARLYLAQSLHAEGKYVPAIKAYEEFLELSPSNPVALSGLEGAKASAALKKNKTRWVVRQDKLLNSRRADFSPMFNGDILYFTTTNEKVTGDKRSEITGMKKSDIWMSKKDEQGNRLRPEPVEGELNSELDEGIMSFSPDGSTMYLTKARREPNANTGVEIYTSQRSDAKWSAPVKFEITADTVSSYAHPAVSPDGNYLYFASDMPGTGGKDIWRINLKERSGSLENLGTDINTPGDEMFPYMLTDSIMYFSSDGHPGLGGLDIFCATLQPSGRWTVTNMGSPINSEADDFGMTFLPGADHPQGYMSSNRGDGRGYDHIYTFELPDLKINISGWVVDRDDEPVPNSVIRIVGNDGSIQKAVARDDGSFSFPLQRGVSYVMMAGGRGYLNAKQEFTADNAEEDAEYEIDFVLASINKPNIIENIFYDFDKATLRPESEEALDELVKLLADNPNITIEMASHTDRVGTEEYNLDLSERRAKAVIDYLISKGIAPERLQHQGYGKSRPKVVTKRVNKLYPQFKEGDVLTEEYISNLPPEDQEAADQVNRRTEFQVLSVDYQMF
ncbi:MAG: OmpA family protein [Muribaculaceae bacterium]|jgi:outer membrane protein OmpA-like peptidoglycan-associated protein/tetratricopeptide (TPR) repeat protein|nr:OmpA family protein [Prevotella sp.]